MELNWLASTDVDALLDASDLFDDPVRRDWAQRFLDEPTHHLCVASVDGRPVGFVSGIEIHLPDKGPEMLLYELGVDTPHRRGGIGAALTGALRELAGSRGCSTMWVLTEMDNEAAVATYRSTGALEPTEHVMMDWQLPTTGDVEEIENVGAQRRR